MPVGGHFKASDPDTLQLDAALRKAKAAGVAPQRLAKTRDVLQRLKFGESHLALAPAAERKRSTVAEISIASRLLAHNPDANLLPDLPSAPPPEANKLWCYLDPSGQMKGPFTETQMADWCASGFLPPELRVGEAGSAPNEYVPLAQLGAQPFQR